MRLGVWCQDVASREADIARIPRFLAARISGNRMQLWETLAPCEVGQACESYIGDNGKENGNYYSIRVILGYIGIMEKKMEATIVLGLYWVI